MTEKHDPWRGAPAIIPRSLRVSTAIPVTLCMQPGHAARLILVAGPGATLRALLMPSGRRNPAARTRRRRRTVLPVSGA